MAIEADRRSLGCLESLCFPRRCCDCYTIIITHVPKVALITKIDGGWLAGAIPELLLTVDSRTGTGILSNVAYASRLLTSGGVAPVGACTDGATAAVPYGAVYAFWAAKR
ncbi:hypothetical protein C7C45_17310 [Micromonospora arborensis]|uniref:Uncharacterized protein n=1 Tax=Micromonospora arborensis TaxID=2116518 RepID=A0A318NSH9_9ACTN|nr:DUF3455 domain-containing protein [Micromonospora arborensis]PYC68750.1 hypothetical protein C7C45_17310 [Micromonospora arborensis]